MSKPSKPEINEYLIELRDSGEVNMWGASPYLQAHFGMTHAEAKRALLEWIDDMSKGVRA